MNRVFLVGVIENSTLDNRLITIKLRVEENIFTIKLKNSKSYFKYCLKGDKIAINGKLTNKSDKIEIEVLNITFLK